MAIQNRRGNIANFDANKMLPGEFAYALDTGELFYCVSPGTVRRCATKEELEQILTSAPEAYIALQELIVDLENETVLTGILADISNLKSTKLALTGDSKTNTTTFAEAATLANINSAETHASLFGKIKKFFSFVGTTPLTTTAQTVSSAANEILAANRSGWSMILATDKLTYKSASAPYFVCNTLNTSNAARDFRAYLSIGMKIKLTQDTAVKYFFITAIDATSITLYGGTDYVLTTTAITNVCYSVVQAPHGFPIASTGLGIDFVIEQGSNVNGNYTKWASGKLEMWNYSNKISNAQGKIYLQYPINPIATGNSASLTFGDIPHNTYGDRIMIMSNVDVPNAELVATNPTSGIIPNATIRFHWDFKGKWK